MIRFFALLIFPLLIVTAIMLYVTQNKKIDFFSQNITEQGKALIGGDFTLTGTDGNIIRDSDFRDKVMLVFFGFTHCPDVCPVTAATFAVILKSLGDEAKSIAPIFITVDPGNDTPEVLKEYFANIDSRIIALTGTDEQIKQAADSYKAYFSEAKIDEKSDAHNEHGEHGMHRKPKLVNHSGFIYLMDKNGVYIKHFPYNADADEITAEIRKLLE